MCVIGEMVGVAIYKLKLGMVEQLGREVCNIWCQVARKKA